MNSNSQKNTCFNPLYGTGHKFYGSLDYFYDSNSHKNTGQWDSYLTFNFKPGEKIVTQLAFHGFETTGKIVDYTDQNVTESLNNELNLSVGYDIFDHVKLTGGYSRKFTDKLMRCIKNPAPLSEIKSFQHRTWASINFNPQLFFKLNQ